MEMILNHVTRSLDNNTPHLLAITDSSHPSNNQNNSSNDTTNTTTNNINSSTNHNSSSTTSNSFSDDDESTPRSANRPVLVTDGQLHLRQVVHPKSAYLGVSLPHTYRLFFDLRKEFRNMYNLNEEMNNIQEMATRILCYFAISDGIVYYAWHEFFSIIYIYISNHK